MKLWDDILLDALGVSKIYADWTSGTIPRKTIETWIAGNSKDIALHVL